MKNIVNLVLSVAVLFSSLPAQVAYSARRPVTVANDNEQDPAIKAKAEADAAAAELAANPPPPIDPDMNAREVFTRYMGIEVTRHLFRAAQWELLGTKEDTAYTHFFFELNQHLNGLFDKIKELHDLQLEQASSQFRHSHSPLRPGYTPYINRILRTAQQSARAIGFPATAIENIEVYSQRGEMNAYTISGNHNRIIILLFSELLEQLSMGQLNGVLSHELGHIRLLHSVKGIMHNILMTMVMRTFAAKQYTASLGPIKEGMFPALVCEHGVGGKCAHSHATSPLGASMKEQNVVVDPFKEKDIESRMNNMVIEGITSLSELPANVRIAIVKQYLLLLLQSLETEEGPAPAKQVLIEALRSQESFASEINGEKLMFALGQAQLAISRGQEKSADRIATSTVPNEYLANSMVQLSGPPMDPNIRDPKKKREELAKLRQMIVDGMAETHAKHKGTDRSGYVGSTHPAMGIRIDDILKIETFPEIVFADPVLKLLLLEDQLQTQIARPGAARTLEQLRRDILVLIEARGLATKVNARFDKTIQYAAFNRAAILKALTALILAPVQTDEIKQGVAMISAKLNDSVEMIRQLDARLAAYKPKNAEEKATILARRKMIANLMAADTYGKAVDVQASARPANANIPARSRRLLPLEGQRAANPDRQFECDYLLHAAVEAEKNAPKK